MAIINLGKQSLFSKPNAEIPTEFLEACERNGKDYIAHMNYNSHYVVLSNDVNRNERNKIAISSLLGENIEKPDYVMSLKKEENVVKYKDVCGFFSFRNVVFYRAKGVAGKCITDDMTFTEKIKSLFPDEFQNVTATQISNLLVQTLKPCM